MIALAAIAALAAILIGRTVANRAPEVPERAAKDRRGGHDGRDEGKARGAGKDYPVTVIDKDHAKSDRKDQSKDQSKDYPVKVIELPAVVISVPVPGGARAAAEALYTYVAKSVRLGQGSNLGSRGSPSKLIESYQRAMGRLTPDGMYGPATRARGKELLGKPFPARPGAPPATRPARELPPPATRPARELPPPATRPARELPPPAERREPSRAPTPATPAPEDASASARALLEYAREQLALGRGARLGTRGAPSSVVADAQSAMGLKPDGIYGPATRARGKELLGVDFPVRQ